MKEDRMGFWGAMTLLNDIPWGKTTVMNDFGGGKSDNANRLQELLAKKNPTPEEKKELQMLQLMSNS
jgi:hypothetical protein